MSTPTSSSLAGAATTSSAQLPDSFRSIISTTAAAAVTAWGFYLVVKLANQRWAVATTVKELQQAKDQLKHEQNKTKMERRGRTRAEQELRSLRLASATGVAHKPQPRPIGALPLDLPSSPDTAEGAAAAEDVSSGASDSAELLQDAAPASNSTASEPACTDGMHTRDANSAKRPRTRALRSAAAVSNGKGSGGAEAYPLKPIGYLQSCFTTRNGTPRQPLLVPAARARLQLLSDVPYAALEGLEQYSHVWVVYIFHQNTNLPKALQPGLRSGIKAMINVPRLNGSRMGVLATRSPHRPVPIGLSVARVLAVSNGCVLLGGGDLVDGSPVLDIKPYVPFCDSVPAALAPHWVQAEADDEPLAVGEVRVPPAALAQLATAWAAVDSLYPDAASFTEFVTQVLSRDIRSLHQRLGGDGVGSGTTYDHSTTMDPATANTVTALPSVVGGAACLETDMAAGQKLYHVVLEAIDVSYVIDGDGAVVVVGARPNKHPDNKRERARRAAELHAPVRNRDLGTPYC